VFALYAPTKEERDLWVNGIHRILKIPVKDPMFKAMGIMRRNQLMAEVAPTEGSIEDKDYVESESEFNQDIM
jgi:hypothetical protein